MTTLQKAITENQYNDNNLGIIEIKKDDATDSVREEFPNEKIFGVDEDGFIQGDFEFQPTEIQERFEEILIESLKEEDVI